MVRRISLEGWWQIKFDEQDLGQETGWASHPPHDCRQINVPSCWNEVFPDRFSYDGIAWYFREFTFLSDDEEDQVELCFEGVNYRCQVFVNGQAAGSHEGGFTAFSLDITRALRPGAVNLFAIRVDSRLDAQTLPPRGVDWFNYGGIYRSIYLKTARAAKIAATTIKTRMDGSVLIQAALAGLGPAQTYQLTAVVDDQTGAPVAQAEVSIQLAPGEDREERLSLVVPKPHLWKLSNAYLYNLRLELLDSQGQLVDQEQKRFGIREFAIAGRKILLNGEEVKLVGCSKHDEYPLTGRTVTREQLIKDYDLLRQMNVNFVRLAHYPHNRLEHAVLDELGMLAISEIPMVFLREAQMTSPEVLARSKQMLAEMIRAEKNTTGILFWSLFIECETDLPSTRAFVKAMVDYARELDDTRFIVMASNRPLTDVTYEFFDVIGINYWEGWYGGESVADGVKFLEAMAERYHDKPMLITSHGWEGIYGERSYVEKTPWSEDAQADYLSKMAAAYMSFRNVIGEIVWTFADFRVSNWQDISEPGERWTYLGRPAMINHKGMVDFYRRPKSTYFVMSEKFALWQELISPQRKHYGQNLQVKVFSNRQLAGLAAAFDFIDKAQALLAEQETINVIFAVDASQVDFLASLQRNRMFLSWRRINAFLLDEYVEDGPDTSQGLAGWLKDRLIDHLPFNRFETLNGQAEDLPAECQRYASLLQENPIDLACLGIGENGHLAGVPCQALTVATLAMMQAAHILCIAPGAYKAPAVWKGLNGDISVERPATVLRRHPDATLYLDKDSAGLL